MSALDIVFISGNDPGEDLQRLLRVLDQCAPGAGRVLAVVETGGCEEALSAALAGTSRQWLALSSATGTSALSRALLLCEHDVLVVSPGASPAAGSISELLAVSEIHDRVGAVVPVSVEGEPNPDDARHLLGTGVVRALEVPAPDGPLILIRQVALRLAGAPDNGFASVRDALADFCLRAQRLGFLCLRAQRALCGTWRFDSVQLPRSHQLEERHPAYAAVRTRAETGFAARLPLQTVSARHGSPNVVLDVRHLPNDAINGTGVYAIELCRALTRHTPARVSLLCANEAQRDSLTSLGRPIFLSGQHLAAVDLLHRPAQVFRAADLRLLLETPAPLVISYQDLIAYRAPSVHGSAAEHETYQVVSSLAVRSSQAVIAISAHNREEIIREFHVSPEEVHLVHHGVHAADFSARDEQGNRSLLTSAGIEGPYLFYVGSDYAHKNLRLLLAAYSRLRAGWRCSDGVLPQLAVVGHPSGSLGGLYPDLRERPPPGVRYLGDVSQELLRALYQEARALVFLSTYEGFGLPILEAMASGTPVLCSRLTSIPEVAGNAAVYADDLSDGAVAAQMRSLCREDAFRADLITRGRTQASAFTWEATARRTYAAYEQAWQSASSRSLHERKVATHLVRRLVD